MLIAKYDSAEGGQAVGLVGIPNLIITITTYLLGRRVFTGLNVNSAHFFCSDY